MKKDSITIVFVLLLIVFVSSLIVCKSPSQPNPPGETAIANPSFANDIQPIFNANCTSSGCHNASAAAGLNLNQGQAYANLVNLDATSESNLKRVLPGDAQNSYLIIKLEGRQNVGGRMPLNRSPLSDVQIQNIKNWINNGANNN